MTTTSMLLGRSAAPHVLEHEGRTYQFRALAQKEKSAFERWLIARTRSVLSSLYEGEELQKALKDLEREAVTTPTYDFHSELAQSVASTPGGAVKLASILMGCSEDEAIALWLVRQEEVTHLLGLVIAESLPNYPKQAGEPEKNARPPG